MLYLSPRLLCVGARIGYDRARGRKSIMGKNIPGRDTSMKRIHILGPSGKLCMEWFTRIVDEFEKVGVDLEPNLVEPERWRVDPATEQDPSSESRVD
jgi:hypothetical protein